MIIFITSRLFSLPRMLDNPFPSIENLNSFKAGDISLYDEDFLSKVNISLITVEPGKEIFSYFGHSAFEIQGPNIDSRFYDLGVFAPSEDFYQNLIWGKLFYGAYLSSAEINYATYKTENRKINKIPLSLSTENRFFTIGFINYNTRYENHIYLYNFYLDNCATRLRDIINKTSNGDFEAWASGQMEETTFRKLTTAYMNRNFPISFTFNYLQGPFVDRPINRYEAAFIPERLDALLNEYQNGENGKREYPLLGSTFHLAMNALLFSLVFIFILHFGSKIRILNRVVHSISFMLFTFLFLLSATLLFMQFFSYHEVTYHNENLFLISPLVIIFATESLLRIFKPESKIKTATFLYKTLMIISLFYMVIKGLFFTSLIQNNFYVFCLIFPIYLYESIKRKQEQP